MTRRAEKTSKLRTTGPPSRRLLPVLFIGCLAAALGIVASAPDNGPTRITVVGRTAETTAETTVDVRLPAAIRWATAVEQNRRRLAATTTTTAPPPTTTTAPPPPATATTTAIIAPPPVTSSGVTHTVYPPVTVNGRLCSRGCIPAVLPCVIPDYICRRESGMTLDVYNPTEDASGKYQFIRSTWNRFMGYLNAADAPEEVQDERARIAWAGGAGCGHWSAC